MKIPSFFFIWPERLSEKLVHWVFFLFVCYFFTAGGIWIILLLTWSGFWTATEMVYDLCRNHPLTLTVVWCFHWLIVDTRAERSWHTIQPLQSASRLLHKQRISLTWALIRSFVNKSKEALESLVLSELKQGRGKKPNFLNHSSFFQHHLLSTYWNVCDIYFISQHTTALFSILSSQLCSHQLNVRRWISSIICCRVRAHLHQSCCYLGKILSSVSDAWLWKPTPSSISLAVLDYLVFSRYSCNYVGFIK